MESTNSENQIPVSTESLKLEDAAAVSSIGFTDILLFAGLFGLAVYWLFLRKPKKAIFDGSSMKPIAVDASMNRANDTGFVGKMKNTGRNIVAFYGSQTGTAEEFASRLAKEANRYGMKAMVSDPEECDMEDLSKLHEIENSLAIFCMATYGEGDPTDNAQEFYQWLQSGDVDMTGLKYAVFALGNKTYEHYNDMGKYVDKRLEEMGATRVFELGLGDDDANIEDDFITWKEHFWAAVCEHFNVEKSGEDINFRQYQLIVHDEVVEEKVYKGEVARLNSYKTQKPPFDVKNPYLAPVTMNRELYRGERSCMHIELDVGSSKIRYESGDHVAVYPTNNPDTVEKIGKLLDVDLETVITLRNLDEDSSKKHPFPCPCSYRTALLHYVDITSIPRTHVLKEIAEYATNDEEKAKLKLMGSPSEEGKALYNEWITKSCRSIVHIIEDFSSLKPALDHLLELLPRLQSRYYSISSSPKLFPETIHVTAVLIDYETKTNRKVEGVATGWLKQKKVDNGHKSTVPVFVRRSQFRLPSKPQTPIIMIGPGTGLAPFRGFIQERSFMKKEGKPIGDTILYFGCRKESEDFLYQDELKEFQAEGALTKVHLAFSRDTAEKVYVTHLLQQNRQEIWDVIGVNNGHIYVCGDARTMARDVHDIILDIIQQEGGKSKADAESYLKRMESQRRYSADVWS